MSKGKKDFSSSAASMIDMMDGVDEIEETKAEKEEGGNQPTKTVIAPSVENVSTPKRKVGRPPLPESQEKRDQKFHLLLTPTLAKDFKVLAACYQMTVNSLIIKLMERAVAHQADKIALYKKNFGDNGNFEI